MSKRLADLLDQPEIAVSSAISKLESLSGFSGEDIKFLADISNKARSKVQSLGLDADDTDGAELYHALLTKFEHDEKVLLHSLGLKNLKADGFASKIAEFINHADMPKNVWALKRSVAKNLLKKQPPKHLMRKLNYRSIDSLLKRENISALFGAIEHTESGRWQKDFWRNFSKLSSADFENRTVEIVTLSGKRWESVSQNSAVITNVPALGAAIVWPSTSIKRIGAIGMSLFLAHHINSLRISSAYIKLHQVENDFAATLKKACQQGIDTPLELSHLPINWKTIFHHYGKTSASNFQEAFEPHILQEDIKLPDELKVLSKLSPVFKWWSSHEHTAANLKGHHVSLNIMDVMGSYVAGLKYEQRNIDHFRSSLWHKLVDQYLEHDGVKRLITSQIGPMEPVFETEENISSSQFINNTKYAGAL
jgi:hypothetical protein